MQKKVKIVMAGKVRGAQMAYNVLQNAYMVMLKTYVSDQVDILGLYILTIIIELYIIQQLLLPNKYSTRFFSDCCSRFKFTEQNTPYAFKIITCEEYEELMAETRKSNKGPGERSNEFRTLTLLKTKTCPKDAYEAYIMWENIHHKGLPGNYCITTRLHILEQPY